MIRHQNFVDTTGYKLHRCNNKVKSLFQFLGRLLFDRVIPDDIYVVDNEF